MEGREAAREEPRCSCLASGEPEEREVITRPLEEVIDELNAASDVAGFLKEQGIKGTRGHCYSCPVAEYALRETGALRVDVSSSYTTAVYWRDGVTWEESADHEDNVSEFIEHFDDGGHPELDSEENRDAA